MNYLVHRFGSFSVFARFLVWLAFDYLILSSLFIIGAIAAIVLIVYFIGAIDSTSQWLWEVLFNVT